MQTSTKSLRAARGRMPSGQPNPVDVHVGARVRFRRAILGMSQSRLADELGLTFQQVQKYERGANRISASRLWDLSRVLGVPVSHFFEDMADGTACQSPRYISTSQNPDAAEGNPGELPGSPPMQSRETLELVRAYSSINEAPVRRRIYDLTRTLSALSNANPLPADDSSSNNDHDMD